MPRLPVIAPTLLAVTLLAAAHPAPAQDVRRLTGPEAAALKIAVDDFRVKRFAKIGDLQHYTVELRRRGGTLEVGFFPEQKRHFAPTEAGTGGGTVYGDEVRIFVSLKRLRIVDYQFAR